MPDAAAAEIKSDSQGSATSETFRPSSGLRDLLNRRLAECEFSVRASNVFAAHNLKYVADLIPWTPEELMKLPNFGRKSLREVEEFLAPHGLRLGTVSDILATTAPLAPSSDGSDNVPLDSVNAKRNQPSVEQRVFLVRNLGEFYFSTRVRNVFELQKLLRVGDLAQVSSQQLRAIRNFGRHALKEVEQFLATKDLKLGAEIAGWSEETAKAWSRDLSEELERARVADVSVALPVSSEGLLESELPAFVNSLKGFGQRRAEMIVRLFGWSGSGPTTLETVGNQFGVTREYVRQVRNSFLRRCSGKHVRLPTLSKSIETLISAAPASERSIIANLKSLGLTRIDFAVDGLLVAADVFGQPMTLAVTGVDGVNVVGTEDQLIAAQAVPKVARSVASKFGCGTAVDVAQRISQKLPASVPEQLVRTVLEAQRGCEWLSEDKTWFWIGGIRRNRLANVMRKILAVTPRVSLSEARAAIQRVHRLEGFAPPRAILRQFCAKLPYAMIEDDSICAFEPIDPSAVLGTVEHVFWTVMKENGSLMGYRQFAAECLKRGVNQNTFHAYLSFSPIVIRLARETYGLVGADVSPGQVEVLRQPRETQQVFLDHGWSRVGELWIKYRLSSPNLRTGTFTIPLSLTGILQGKFAVQWADKGATGSVLAENGKLSGFRSAFSRGGAEEGDAMLASFNLQKKVVRVQVGADEDLDEDSFELKAAPEDG